MTPSKRLLAPTALIVAAAIGVALVLRVAGMFVEFRPGLLLVPLAALLLDLMMRRGRMRNDPIDVPAGWDDPNGEVLRAIYLSQPTPAEAAGDTLVRVVRVPTPATGETVKMEAGRE